MSGRIYLPPGDTTPSALDGGDPTTAFADMDNVDGGEITSNFGGSTAIDGGTP